MHEVRMKRESWQSKKDKAEFLGRHMIPVIHGPKERFYIVDQHHLARALHDEGQKHVLVSVITDLRMLDRDAFWVFLDNRGWCHPYDQRGRRCPFADIPESVTTTPIAALPANCEKWAVSLRTRRRSANFCGPIFSDGGSDADWSSAISTPQSAKR